MAWSYPKPEIMTRAEWGAKPMVIDLPKQTVTRITVHHTGEPQDMKRSFADKLRGLQAWSQRDDFLDGGKPKPKWADIPYHYYIDVHGMIAECRPIEYAGDTNTNYDTLGHALVVVEGDFPKDWLNFSQRKALRNLMAWLSIRYHVAPDKIAGHRDMAPGQTTCPGQTLYDYLPNLREWVAGAWQKAGLTTGNERMARSEH